MSYFQSTCIFDQHFHLIDAENFHPVIETVILNLDYVPTGHVLWMAVRNFWLILTG